MRILVTGGAGFIGSTFIRYLVNVRPSHELINFDKLSYAGNLLNVASVSNHPNYRFIKGNICDRTAVDAAIAGCDAVVHFAAESHVDRTISEPGDAIETNVKGTFNLLQAARRHSIRRFVHISTDEVYGDLPPNSFAHEHSPLNPSSPYSSSKAASDLLVRSYVRTYAFPALIARSSNNYGPHQFPEKFLPLMITNALDNVPLPIYGDGKQLRTWLHVEDNCRGILAILERGRVGEIYNLGGVDLEENLSMVHRLLNLMDKPESLITHVKDRPGHDRRYALNSQKAALELGWKPEISLEFGLPQTIDWYKSSKDWLAAIRNGEYRKHQPVA
jgi:dTDP-glucose 4,6-dehydratase